MPATIFSGGRVRHLKPGAQLLNQSSRDSGTVDPTVTATEALPGSLYQNSSTGLVYRKLDSGSTTNWVLVPSSFDTGVNYILNGNAEKDASGWATYADAAAPRPVDGTGGSPNVTWSRSTTSPLRGLADFNFVKDAANRQGQGVSDDFTIASADKGKLLGIEFECELVSGTYDSGSATTDSDLVVVIYDVTNAVNLEPIPLKLSLPIVGTTSKFYATFPASSNSTSYRLCLHVATTSASAFTIAVDSVRIAPVQTINQVSMTDPVSETVTLTSSGGGSITLDTGAGYLAPTVVWWRSGKFLNAQYSFRNGTGAAASGAAGTVRLPLPSGYVIDTANLAPGAGGIRDDGTAWNSGLPTGGLSVENSTSINIFDSSGSALTVAGIAALYYFTGKISVPIVGWSSNVTTVAPQVQGGTVGFRARGNPSGSPVDSVYTDVVFPTVITDSSGTYNTSTGKWTCPITGYYDLSVVFLVTGTFGTSPQIQCALYNETTANYIQITVGKYPNSFTGFPLPSQADAKFVFIKAGEVIKPQVYVAGISSLGFENSSSISGFSASLVSAVQQIPADSKTRNVRTVTAAATILPTDDIIYVDASGGAVTVTLPTAAAMPGRGPLIQKIDSSANKVTVTRSGSDTIQGLTSVFLGFVSESVKVTSDGSTVWRMELDASIACSALPASQGITEDTTTTIDLATVEYDPWGMISTASDTVTVPLAGIYRLNSQTWIDATPNKDNGIFVSYYSVNGGSDQFLATTILSNFGAGQSITTESTKEMSLAAGDVVRFRLYKDINTGASTDNLIPARCFYQLTKVR